MKRVLVLCAMLLTIPVQAEEIKSLAEVYKEAEYLTQIQTLRTKILYSACIYSNFEATQKRYSYVYEDAVCICFADKILDFEYNTKVSEYERNLYWYSEVRYKQVQNEALVKCIKENEHLKWL